MKRSANLRVRRGLVVLIVAGWIASGVWTPGVASAAPGNVLRTWLAAGLAEPYGVGYTGRLWISDVPLADKNHEFTVEGALTGRAWSAGWVGSWLADMTYLPGPRLLCQVNVGGDKGIYCWSPETGAVAASIVGAFPWTSISQRGLAYRAADDTFYIGGWNQGILYRVKGLSHADRGAVVSQCALADGRISGLAYNAAFNVVWVATNSESDTVYKISPDTCEVLGTLPHPEPGFNGAGLDLDDNGNLWMVSHGSRRVFLIESGLPASAPSVASIAEVVSAAPDAAFRSGGLRRALEARLDNIRRSIDAGDIKPALQMLRALRMRVDGCGATADQDDWIVDCGQQSAVRTAIDGLIASFRS